MLYYFLLEGSLLDVNPGTVFWTIVTFFILLFILSRTAWKPIVFSLSERERKIRESMESAEEAVRKMEATSQESKEILQKAIKESSDILREAREKAVQLRQRIHDEAKKEAAEITKNAKLDIEVEVKKARKLIKMEIVDMITEGAEILLKEKVNKSSVAKQQEMLAKIIKDLPSPSSN